MCFCVQINHTRKELLFLMFLKINLRSPSSLHKIFYSLSDRGLTTLNISSFNTGNVTDMRNMFDFDLALPSLDVSNFDTSKVTDMSGMFNGDSYLTSLDVSILIPAKSPI